jgi:hypothetical protein
MRELPHGMSENFTLEAHCGSGISTIDFFIRSFSQKDSRKFDD